VAAVVARVDEDDRLTVVGPQAETLVVQRAQLARPPQRVPGKRTDVGRLVLGSWWWASTSEQRARLDSFALDCWNELDARARKAAADDLLALGRVDLLHRTDAPLDTLTWLRAVDLSSRGQHSEAVRLALRLPRDRYRGKLALFAAGIDHADDQWADVEDLLSTLAEEQRGICRVISKVLLTSRGAATSGNGERRLTDDELGEILDVADTWLSPVKAVAALLGGSVELGPNDLERLDKDLLDDVIDAGLVTASAAHNMRTNDRVYALARLDPSKLNDEELAQLDLPAAKAKQILRRVRQSGSSELADELAGLDHAGVWQRTLEQSQDALAAAGELFAIYDDPRAPDVTALATDGGLPSEALLQDPDLETFLFERREHLGDPATLGSTGSLAPAQRRFVARYLLDEALKALLRWDWARCEDLARKVLATKADDNGMRAEANTLIGVVRWMEDDRDAAAKALAVASSGSTSPAHHINAAIAQQAVDEQKAVASWDRVAALTDAPLEVRSASLVTAIHCWFAASPENSVPPASLVSKARGLAQLNIERDHLRSILEFLAALDDDWLARPKSMSSAKHAKSPEVKILVASAQGYEEELRALASLLRSGNTDTWVEQKRDRWVDEALDGLMVDEPEAQYVHGGSAILDADVPMADWQRLLLRAAVSRGVGLLIDPAEGEPATRYLEWIGHDRSKTASLDDALSDQQEWVERTQEAAARSLAACHLDFRFREVQEFAQLHDNVVDALQTTPRWRLELGAVREAGSSIVGFCEDTLKLCRRLRTVVDAELREPIGELERLCRDLSASAKNFT
jgi:hypothetical protein